MGRQEMGIHGKRESRSSGQLPNRKGDAAVSSHKRAYQQGISVLDMIYQYKRHHRYMCSSWSLCFTVLVSVHGVRRRPTRGNLPLSLGPAVGTSTRSQGKRVRNPKRMTGSWSEYKLWYVRMAPWFISARCYIKVHEPRATLCHDIEKR